MESTHPGYFDYPAEIPCHITSMLPFHVQWSREVGTSWVDVGPRKYFRYVGDIKTRDKRK